MQLRLALNPVVLTLYRLLCVVDCFFLLSARNQSNDESLFAREIAESVLV